jgi:hypothetical protein
MGLSAIVTASTVVGPRIEVVKVRDKSKMAVASYRWDRAGFGFTAELLGELARCDPWTS